MIVYALVIWMNSFTASGLSGFLSGCFSLESFLKVLILALGWYLCYNCFDIVKDIEPLKTFIPHEILGVAADATPGAVKKAYRKLSREKHPDKNPDNPEAVNEFIQITKAYTIMTDEKARDNFLKYGNPDGKGSFAVGIALPNFLQK
jgi:translocation protein SEC63